eukprot:CAMPEP_0202712616 /NCGR_PEP_ID=MMETSP1385-20130828/43538_1 /ASSEMBLY_ACC=CAM_ASM_000861 /TAXON_ID=933848 /ORGANISM="Elphidium margaritaceum" /LENGTH=456 /DNA_ID=CAMNT_0049372703 /DNA_START=38 /DNA_END=1408 /DNA_ORIENTATION=-
MANATNSAAASGQRSNKFRHVYGEPAKQEQQFIDLNNPLTSGEGQYVSANNKFVAVSKASGGGPVYILDINKPGRLSADLPLLSVQKGKVWDHDFHPFIPNMIATASDDSTVAVTQFPITGLSEDITKADVMLQGHTKKVTACKFNPSANSILASASFDRTVKLWNIETQDNVMTFSDSKDNIYSIEWNFDGSQLASTGKDKMLRIFDPRIPDEAAAVKAFDGTKSSKAFWLPNLGWLGAVGFDKMARRSISFWDLKDLSKPLFNTVIDQVASTLIPHYDNDTGLLFLAGKGDGAITYSEVINDGKVWYPLGAYRTPEPQKGGGWMAKRACDVWKCEINRFFKLTKTAVIPISFNVPRKSGAEVFQDDIYPDTFAGKPALTADEWLNGANKDPVLCSMDPSQSSDNGDGGATFTKKKTYQELQKENEALQLRVKELEEKLSKYETVEPQDDSKADE